MAHFGTNQQILAQYSIVIEWENNNRALLMGSRKNDICMLDLNICRRAPSADVTGKPQSADYAIPISSAPI